MTEFNPNLDRPKATRALQYAQVLADQVLETITKLNGYLQPESKQDLNDSVEISLRTTLQTFSALYEKSINCPPAYFPGITEVKPPLHIGDGSGAALTAKQEALTSVNIKNMLEGFATQLPKRIEPKANVEATEPSIKPTRGRPKGSKNQPKV